MAFTFKHGDRPLDDYTIQRAIGRGGFGEVYYAMSDGGREVALKYLKENPAVELRGVSHCINLKSPHLVSIFDVKKNADGDYFIIMEYCSGPSLRDLMIAEPKGFPPEKAAFFTREIAKGLSYLHDRGIVHRDLKPGNIFFDDGYVKIGDYGLSKFISVSRHSAQTASVGTVHYMAPEIGSGNYSRGVDIYALGVVLYEMLLGKVPFEGSSMAEVLMKHLTAQPELDELPGPFGNVIRKALEKDPKDRYQTAEEMLDDLLSGEEMQRSLAGFSTKSLEGAVRVGGGDRTDSPMPSPNPPPRVERGYGAPGPPVLPGGPLPRGFEGALSDRLARKMDRISRKIDRKVAKFAGRRGWNAPPRPVPAGGDPADIPWAQPAPPRGESGKRIALLGMLLVVLSVGFGLVVGNTYPGYGSADIGAAAGMLVAALYFGALLGQYAVQWFGVRHGPGWAEKLIRLGCGAPLLAVGCAPLFNLGLGMPVWLGLSTLAALKSWEREREEGSSGEISVKAMFGSALFALILTAIAGGMFLKGRSEHLHFVSAGVAAAVSLLMQAGAWRIVPQGPGAAGTEGTPGAQPAAAAEGVPGTRPAVAFEGGLGTPPMASGALALPGHAEGVAIVDPYGRRPRAIVARMFWSVVAFVLMGGAIVTFLYPLIAAPENPHVITAVIIVCTGFAAFMVFALRKTTLLKRVGFWRETLRPFLISVSLFGIGGTTTGIAREWNCSYDSYDVGDAGDVLADADLGLQVGRLVEVEARVREAQRRIAARVGPLRLGFKEQDWRIHGRCITDEGRVALVAGLVMSSLMFLGLTLFTGGKPRVPRSPKPFLREGESAQVMSADAPSSSGGVGVGAGRGDVVDR